MQTSYTYGDLNNENRRKLTKYLGPYICNKFPGAVTKSPSHTTFTNELKKHYLELQNI